MSSSQALEQLLNQAIEISLAGQYEKAIDLYRSILEEYPNHLATNLALAYALMQNSELEESESIYKKILLDFPLNTIASNQLNKLKLLKKTSPDARDEKMVTISNFEFVQIPGKTRVISLVMLGQLNILLGLQIGQKVEIVLKKRHVEIRTIGGEYIGVLPDDLSRKIYQLIDNGNIYEAFIKFASKNEVEIFMREVFQSATNQGIISFTRSIIEPRVLPSDGTESESDDKENKDDEKSGDDGDEDENSDEEDEDDNDEPELLDALAEKLTEDEAELSSYTDGDDFVGSDE